MPNLNYTYFGPTNNGNCAPAIAGPAAPGTPGPNLLGLAAGGGTIPYTWAQLCNAANAAGAFPGGAFPAAVEMGWRIHTLAVSACTQAGFLEATPLLPHLERQERINLAYAVGMTLAVHTAQSAGFLFPQHFSRFRRMFGLASYVPNPAFAADTPDIVNTDLIFGTCQVWEAKGRAGTLAAGFPLGGVSGVLNGAMDQARTVQTLLVPGTGQVVPNARVASLARLDPVTNRWQVHVADPPDGEPVPDRTEDDVQKLAFYRDFYAPYVEVVADSGETVAVGGITYAVARVPGTSVWTGLDERIKNLFTEPRRRSPERIVGAIEDYVMQGYPQDDDPDRFISGEGIFTQATEENEPRPST